MVNKKNFYILLLPYLTIISSLYHIFYWNSFGLNGLSIVSIEDILKSAIGSILLAFLATISGYLITQNSFFSNKNIASKPVEWNSKESKKKGRLLIGVCILLFIVKQFIFIGDEGVIGSIMLSLILLNFINPEILFSSNFIPKQMERSLLLLTIFLPLFSIGKAIDDSSLISKNSKFKYCTITINPDLNQKDTIKLLGKNEEGFIFMSMDNGKIIYLKSDTVTLQIKN